MARYHLVIEDKDGELDGWSYPDPEQMPDTLAKSLVKSALQAIASTKRREPRLVGEGDFPKPGTIRHEPHLRLVGGKSDG